MKHFIRNNRIHFNIILLIVVFIVCFGLAAYIMQSGSLKNSSLFSPGVKTVTIDENKPYMKLSADGASYSAGQTIMLNVLAGSQNLDVNGFDLLFSYDDKAVEVVKITSGLETYDIFPYYNTGYVSITGTKKLSVNTATSLNNTPIVVIEVRPKQSGQFSFSIDAERGKEKTKMVDNQARIVIPQVGGTLELNVQ